MQRKRANARGVVYMEMLMALMPLLLTFLGICQLAILYAGQLVVQHAASRAARAAIVVLEDDPKGYGKAPRGDLTEGGSDSTLTLPEDMTQGTPSLGDYFGTEDQSDETNSSQSTWGESPSAWGGTPASGGESNSDEDELAGARFGAIRAAAYHPLAVLGPPPNALFERTLESEVASNSISRILAGRFLFNLGAASITLHKPDSEEI